MTETVPERSELDRALELELSDEDILDALAHISGYIDISTEDFRAVYHLAWRHALARLRALQAAAPEDGDGA
ncbi:hypothetical protein [Rhodocyclus purpureus]|uniref:hypothetical protein n=1 Tax=Rhodocyclus purpureus TaxID=1067 RepID=UPI0019126DFD|nr:hypothetical protein [Rhodocyclus purpureus]